MIAVSVTDGVLRVYAEVKVPSAEAGTWSPARQGKLLQLIRDYVEAAEVVDDAAHPRWRVRHENVQSPR